MLSNISTNRTHENLISNLVKEKWRIGIRDGYNLWISAVIERGQKYINIQNSRRQAGSKSWNNAIMEFILVPLDSFSDILATIEHARKTHSLAKLTGVFYNDRGHLDKREIYVPSEPAKSIDYALNTAFTILNNGE